MHVLPSALAPLALYRQFILVQLVQSFDKGGVAVPGKSVKHPWNQRANGRHNAHDPAIWMSHAEAAQLAATLPVPPGAQGWCVGFVITAADPFYCLDIDGCATAQGTWNDAAIELMRELPGAHELSISGQGLHTWGQYQGVAPQHGKRNKLRGIELYTELRFIALGTAASGVMYDATALLPGFIAKYFPPGEDVDVEGWTTGPCADYTVLTDDELMHKAMASVRKKAADNVFGTAAPLPSFSDLWTRNVPVLAECYPPEMAGKEFGQSDADIALAKELAYWTGRDCDRVARLMQQSALKRSKWLPSEHKTYFTDTVMKGVAYCTNVYFRPPIVIAPPVEAGAKLAPKVIEHETFIGRENLAVIFAGCVYIQDENSILLPNGDIVDQARFNAKFAGFAFIMDNEGKSTTKSAWEAFLGNQLVAFPRVEGTAFDPRLAFQDVVSRAGRSWVNTYKAPVVDRRPGDVSRFLELLHKLLPNGEDALILLSYMAAVVQNPGVKFRWAPFIQGTQGNGKSTIVQCLKHALGWKYVFPVKAGMIENGFNSWLERNILYVADDIYSAKDRTDMMEALKSLITEMEHSITLKGIDSLAKTICGNFIFTDNHKDAMKKQDDSRRICTLYCKQQSAWDRRRDGLTKEYFTGPDGLIKWLEGGGYAHVAEYLHTMVIEPRYNPAGECQEAPETSVTREAVIDGRTGIEHDVAEWVELGEPGFCGDFISYHILKDKMIAAKHERSATPLKIKEMMNRLGYEVHRGLPAGRVPTHIQSPDNTRPILYVKRDVWQAEMTDPASIQALYVQAQAQALTEKANRMSVFNQ